MQITFPILALFQRLVSYHYSYKTLQRHYQIAIIKSNNERNNGIETLLFPDYRYIRFERNINYIYIIYIRKLI